MNIIREKRVFIAVFAVILLSLLVLSFSSAEVIVGSAEPSVPSSTDTTTAGTVIVGGGGTGTSIGGFFSGLWDKISGAFGGSGTSSTGGAQSALQTARQNALADYNKAITAGLPWNTAKYLGDSATDVGLTRWFDKYKSTAFTADDLAKIGKGTTGAQIKSILEYSAGQTAVSEKELSPQAIDSAINEYNRIWDNTKYGSKDDLGLGQGLTAYVDKNKAAFTEEQYDDINGNWAGGQENGATIYKMLVENQKGTSTFAGVKSWFSDTFNIEKKEKSTAEKATEAAAKAFGVNLGWWDLVLNVGWVVIIAFLAWGVASLVKSAASSTWTKFIAWHFWATAVICLLIYGFCFVVPGAFFLMYLFFFPMALSLQFDSTIVHLFGAVFGGLWFFGLPAIFIWAWKKLWKKTLGGARKLTLKRVALVILAFIIVLLIILFVIWVINLFKA